VASGRPSPGSLSWLTSGARAVEVSQEGAVATVTMCGSADGNALGGSFWTRLPEVLSKACGDGTVGAVLLTGPAGVFSEGLDLRWYAVSYTRIMRADGGGPVSRAALLRQELGLQGAIQSIASCPVPIIAVIDGACAGIAMEIASACDFRIASAAARFSLPEVGLGFVPDLGILHRLPRLVGEGWARQLALTGEEIDAGRAARIGFVNEVYPDGQTLRAAALAIASRIASQPRGAIEGTRRLLERAQDVALEVSLREGALYTAALLPADLPGHLRAAMNGSRQRPDSSGGGDRYQQR
jgi:enoyl-CoA hydratase